MRTYSAVSTLFYESDHVLDMYKLTLVSHVYTYISMLSFLFLLRVKHKTHAHLNMTHTERERVLSF